jgi:hypothetical protein
VKGGKTPIHIQRWAPADYHQDEHVRLLYARRDWRTLTFYRTFIDVAFMRGGDLPADPEALAASLMMPLADVRTALAYCLDRLVFEEDGRLLQKRVRREVSEELEFRESQVESGRRGGFSRVATLAKGKPKASLPGSGSEPQARRTPAPAPAPAPAPYACAVPPPDDPPVLPPADRAERAIRLSTDALRTKLYGLIDTMAKEDPDQADPTELMRMVTAYDKPDGARVKGVVNAALLTHERLEKSIEDAEAQLAEWRAAHGAATTRTA